MNKQELKEELIRLENQYSAMLIMEMKIKIAIDELNREKRIISKQLQEIENEEFVAKKLEELKKDFSDGYEIYEYTLFTDFRGTDEIGYFVCEPDCDFEEELMIRAVENLESYGYTTPDALNDLMEELGYDDEEQAIEELNLEISDCGYYVKLIEPSELDENILRNLEEIY